MLARLDKAVATMETAAKTLQFSYYASQKSSVDASELSLPIQKAREFMSTWLDEFSKKAKKWSELSASAQSKQGDVKVSEADEMEVDSQPSGVDGGHRVVVTIDL